MTYVDEEKKPDVASGRNVALAVIVHVLLFAALWFFGQLELTEKELVIPVELTVVVDTPPPPPPKAEPKKPVEKKPEQPKPPPKKEDPPKPKEAVEQVQVKTNKIAKVEKPREEKPKEEKKPEAPKKTAAQLREERLKAMRESAKDVTVKAPANPPKEKPPPNWRELLAAGYKPGETNQIAPNEESRCLGILKRAIDDRWQELSPQTGAPGHVHITIAFSRGGAIARHSLAKSCGDALSDAAAMKVVGSLGTVRGLSAAFLDKYSKEPITIRYKIESSR